jgi:anti-anti-sigma factor
MEDFKKYLMEDIVIEKVDITRATYREAGELKKILKEDINKGFKKIIIDLSMCEFMDSTFIGVLVLILKEIAEVGGELRLVQPPSLANTVLAGTRTLELFNILQTVEQAVKSIQYMDTIHNSLEKLEITN